MVFMEASWKHRVMTFASMVVSYLAVKGYSGCDVMIEWDVVRVVRQSLHAAPPRPLFHRLVRLLADSIWAR